MNWIHRWLIRKWLAKHKEEKMVKGILEILGYLIKNTALIIGILEAVSKAIAGIVSATPTKKDDWLVVKVDNVFSAIKKALYTISEIMTGKREVKPNA